MNLKRKVGDSVRINPYAQVTGVVIERYDIKEEHIRFDYKVKLNIPYVEKDTIYTANFDENNKYWWNYFNDDELDFLERNYVLVSR
ncbi:hypothetical protein [Paenibacillus sp. FSL H3-0286]|uniref:hypothetical protein n=1 Tax=Paenibacillus sp. FSL H3-0286 TaxID=2921427 RepID=UPI003249B19D